MRKNYTLCLDPGVAEKVSDLTKTFGGSIGGFAASWVADLSSLTPDEIRKVRHFMQSVKAAASSREKPDPSAREQFVYKEPDSSK